MIRSAHLLLLLAFAAQAPAGDAAGSDDAHVLEVLSTTQPREAAIARGLAWLRGQTAADGLIPGDHGTAMTALAAMAHLATGITPEDAAHGPWLRRTLDGILARQDRNGYFGSSDNSRMYGHGIASLLCAEAMGACRDPDLDERLRAALEKAIAVTVNAARIEKNAQHRGGWRYTPIAGDSDLSLSGWQLLSLVAARKAGITVPDQVVADAVDYARRMISPEGKVGYERAGDDRPALRGLALFALTVSPRDEDRTTIARIAARIQADPPTWTGEWPLYRAHYDALGLGAAHPETWSVVGPQWQTLLLKQQGKDGSWTPGSGQERGHGPAYGTAMAILALAVDRQVLPSFAR
ncbi:MAG: hypothetical protein RLZZ127_2087 [Planctomycetota bacterium]|jgi:hypothetical protein